jgi:hypothetical protein
MHATNALVAIIWFDNKPISLLSIAYSTIDANNSIFICYWHNGGIKHIPCSPILIHYKEYMKGIDVHEKMKGYYSTQTKDHKWWHRVFFHLLDTSLLNAYIMYKYAIKKASKRPILHYKLNYYVARHCKGMLTYSNIGLGIKRAHRGKKKSVSNSQTLQW